MITDEYMNELLKYDYMSNKIGRGPSSMLIRDMTKAKKKRVKPVQVEDPDLLPPPNGCMDVKRWYMTLSA